METNRCGSEAHLLAQIKSSSFKAARLYRGRFQGPSMQMEVRLHVWGSGGLCRMKMRRTTVYRPFNYQRTRRRGATGRLRGDGCSLSRPACSLEIAGPGFGGPPTRLPVTVKPLNVIHPSTCFLSGTQSSIEPGAPAGTPFFPGASEFCLECHRK